MSAGNTRAWLRSGVMLACLTGCSKEPPFELTAWELDATADPFPEHGEVDRCLGLTTDEGVLEIDMEACPYAVVSQPTLRALRRGERLVGGMSHDDLWSEDGGDTHASLILDDEVIWEATPGIPSPPMFHALDITLDRAIPRGSSLVFHLHNHGLNNYRLLPIEVRESR